MGTAEPHYRLGTGAGRTVGGTLRFWTPAGEPAIKGQGLTGLPPQTVVRGGALASDRPNFLEHTWNGPGTPELVA